MGGCPDTPSPSRSLRGLRAQLGRVLSWACPVGSWLALSQTRFRFRKFQPHFVPDSWREASHCHSCKAGASPWSPTQKSLEVICLTVQAPFLEEARLLSGPGTGGFLCCCSQKRAVGLYGAVAQCQLLLAGVACSCNCPEWPKSFTRPVPQFSLRSSP